MTDEGLAQTRPWNDDTPPSRVMRVLKQQRAMKTWQAFLVAHARILTALEEDLVDQMGISLTEFDVLVQLASADGHRLRMADLADSVLLTRSGLTRLIDRMEATGLVARCPVVDDGRGTAAELTPLGEKTWDRALPIHLRGIRRNFIDQLSPDQIENLENAMNSIAGERKM